jgi:1-acyl-sn-glycerol-3-phosphate acyltransferase
MTALRWILSLVFIIQIYVVMALLAVVFTLPALVHRPMALRAIHSWCHWVRWSLRVMLGLRTEIRGAVPRTEVLIAAKHQSFLDIIMIASVCPQPKFIMKAELRWAPILGWYAMRIGCVPVNRGKRGAAIQKMKADVAAGAAQPGQLVIYPQGTRVAPGVRMPYRVGTGVLYEQLGQPCVPAATNVGHFWPKRGILRHPGTAVVEFLPAIPPGLPVADFMQQIETAVETASDRLSAAAR